MKGSKLVEMYKDGNIVVPLYIFKKYKEFNITLNEFIFLMYLCNKGNQILFDPNGFSNELNIELEEIMEMVSDLGEKNLLKVEVVKSEKKVMEEIIQLDDFYNKLSLITMDDINSSKQDSSNNNVFEIIEKEFGRTLSPIEFEIIQAWLDNGISQELVIEALKEATFNGVSNLRYIDKILYEWGKDGVKTKMDVEKRKQKRKKNIQKDEEKDLDLDIMEWDWFDEEE